MKIKTFYAKSMAEALKEVRNVFGPDALLLSTKEIPRKSGVWGISSGVEVVAACDYADEVDTYSPGTGRLPEKNAGFVRGAENGNQPADTYSPAMIVKKAVPSLSGNGKRTKRSALQQDAGNAENAGDAPPPFRQRLPLGMYRDMVSCGVDEDLARALVNQAWEGISPGQRRSRNALTRAVSEAALSMVAVPSAESRMPGKKIVVFVGPTGVGKTTSLAKLAASLALKKRKKVLLVTLDGYRIGAIEQLRAYAGLMGIPFSFVPQVGELARLIEENRRRDYILIDTAGHSPRDMHAMRRLSEFLQHSEQIERHLVLSAAAKQSDLRLIIDRFEECRPDHLLFTKLDETLTPGPILNELVRTKKQFSYYTDGQRVPDDLHPVPGARIIDIVLNRTENALKE
ncbi:MAG TPA: flagellar biosynthesis protein FlhF [Acidobacteriota bacterium]|nr:flagellar biosynthesis protein FlhF [Acidobacteriota bacterium]